MREMVALFLQRSASKDDMLDLTTFSFLYGTLPSAPGVFVYATAYALDIDLVIITLTSSRFSNLSIFTMCFWQVAASMVSCTFLSAPLMFVSAKMIAAANMDPTSHEKLLNAFQFDISILSLLGGVRVHIRD